MKKLNEIWKNLNRSIYVGDRLKANLTALTIVSVATSFLGLILIIINLVSKDYTPLIASIVTFLAGLFCAYLAGVRKNREAAIMIPTVFCVIAFTVYAFTGSGQGTGILWSLMMPIGISYFCSVRNGIILSLYYTVFFFIIFHSPLRERISIYYTQAFMQRFPLLFMFIAIFTEIAMVQYHRTALFEIEHTDRLNEEVAAQTRVARERADKLQRMSEEMVETLARTIDAKDQYTNGHSFRVSEYSVALARRLGWDEASINELRRDALLHDIGKIGVPDAVLNKPGRLTDEEFAMIKKHTIVGEEILSGVEDAASAAEVAAYHHERYDGKGYPKGLSGEKIPRNARVVSIADAYDAMHSDRIYRKALPDEVIRAELVKGMGKQFDPEVLPVFLELFDEKVV